MYNRKEVYDASLEYFKGDDMRTSIWIDKYALQKDGKYFEKTPDDMHKRLAKEFARIEQKYPNPLSYEEIYNLLRDFSMVIPGGSILYGVGNSHSISSLGNCFVIGNNWDSYGSILRTDEEQVDLMKRRAGVGHDLSHLRPALAPVTNAAGSSTGAVSFMERYSNSTREVGQNNRRGALMLTMNIDHKDIEKFITAKDDLTKITGANISVKISDQFMQSIEQSIENDHNHSWRQVWNKLVHQAWKSAEPGVLFWDKIKSESIPSCYGKEWEETSTNPCGEIPLCPYDSCRLLSVNLFAFVRNAFMDNASFDWENFKEVAYKAQRLMDDIVDLEEEKINLILNKIENDPEPEEIKKVEKNLWIKIKSKLLQGRRTGLSAIGLGDLFASLGYTYGSGDSIKLAEEIYKQFAISAYRSSIDMAEERGAFPIWNGDLEDDNPFLKRVLDEEFLYIDHNRYGRRNISLLTIPPSGTISMMAGISSGIEPVYQLYYKRRYKILENTEEKKQFDFIDANGDKWREYTVYHPKFLEWFHTNTEIIGVEGNKWEYNIQRAKNILDHSIDLDLHVKKSPYYKSTAYEIDPIQRIKLQGAIQKWIDHSISSTLNLPEEVSESDVSDIYFTAWKEGLKGVTIYRNNCRTGVLVDVDKKDEFKQHDAPKRPKELECNVHAVRSNGIEYYVLVGLFNNKPYEVFVIDTNEIRPILKNKHKIIKTSDKKYLFTTYDWNNKDKGYNFGPITEKLTDEQTVITRLVSTSLRHGADIKFIVEQLNKTHGDLTSFSKAIARALKNYIKNEKTNDHCPECNSEMVYEAGCKTCKSCGYSKCG